jgi:hypothetical protein
MDTPFVIRAYNLGLKAAPNFASALSEAQIKYYESHLDKIPEALRRGFIVPKQTPAASLVPRTLRLPMVSTVSASPTDSVPHELSWWLPKVEEFAKEHLVMKIRLQDRFAIPKAQLREKLIPIFDPGTLSVADAVKLLGKLGHGPEIETPDILKAAGSDKHSTPTLQLIADSPRPDKDTMGILPHLLLHSEKRYLRLRGYCLASAIYRYAKKAEHLDQETSTWFPDDHHDGISFANGAWDEAGVVRPGIRFVWSANVIDRGAGARQVINIPLKK